MVVMNGEIVEEGTHDELIHAKGKYLGLWSKQVYVKPADEHIRPQSPKKRDAEIINDLTPSCQKAELAKIMKTTGHEEPATQEETTKQSSREPAQEHAEEPTNSDVQMSLKDKATAASGHKREVRYGFP
jgi:cobalamin biosynthesis protein CobT